MHRRPWEAKTKARIVLEGLQGILGALPPAQPVPRPADGVVPGPAHTGAARAPFEGNAAWLFAGICRSVWVGPWGSPPFCCCTVVFPRRRP